MAACMSRHSLMLFAGAILALTFVHGLEAAEPSPDKQPCDKQDNDEPGTLCRATINCYCISGTYLDIPPNLCDTFDQDNIECSSYCKPCPDGKFSPFDNRCLACRPVTPCKPNEEVIINATGRADQVCGCRRQDLTCPPCPEQTTPTFTSTRVVEQATDPQWTFEPARPYPGMKEPDKDPGWALALMFFGGVLVGVALGIPIYRYRKKCYPCLNSLRNCCCAKKSDSENPSQPSPPSNPGPAGSPGPQQGHTAEDASDAEPAETDSLNPRNSANLAASALSNPGSGDASGHEAI